MHVTLQSKQGMESSALSMIKALTVHTEAFSLPWGNNKSNHACSQRLAWMYKPDLSPLRSCCKCVTLAWLWRQQATRSHSHVHSCTHLTWASACMKINSHFLAKALCSRARFSWWSQWGAALGWKVIWIQGLLMITLSIHCDGYSWGNFGLPLLRWGHLSLTCPWTC